MTKLKFLTSLHTRLANLPQDEVEERLRFYSEMIEDRMEEGLSEEDAVAAVGSIEEIAAQITAEIPPAAEHAKPKRHQKIWEIVLLILGSPLWVSLLIAACSVVFSLYISLWSVLISFWAVFVSVAAYGFCGAVVGIGFALSGKVLTGTALIGAGMVCAGLSVLLFFGCRAATEGTLQLTKKLASKIKHRFAKKEG